MGVTITNTERMRYRVVASVAITAVIWVWIAGTACGRACAAGRDLRRTPIVNAFEANKNAVVSIASKQVVRQGNNSLYWDLDDWFFFRPRVQVIPSLGSGFVINPRGYIVTNRHVIEGAVAITVIMADDQQYEAEVIAQDELADMAVLKIEATDPLPAVQLGYSDDLMIGETVLAIGNPFGYQQTLTDGILSAIHRNLETGQGQEMSDLLQISAPINPGNSGGPLLNINGEVIGINTAIRRAAEGIGFAIPIDQLWKQLPIMLDVERLYRIDLGMQVEQPEGRRDEQGEMVVRPGALVREVRPEGAADRAGLLAGDMITAVDDHPVVSVIDFCLALLEDHENRRASLRIMRSPAGELRVDLLLRKRPKPDGGKLMARLFGLRVEQPHYGTGQVIVRAAERGTEAAQGGIQAGDILLYIGSEPIEGLDPLGLLLENVTAGTEVRFTLERVHQSGLFTRRVRFERVLRVRLSPRRSRDENVF